MTVEGLIAVFVSVAVSVFVVSPFFMRSGKPRGDEDNGSGEEN